MSLEAEFERLRPRLERTAYAVLGSVSEAEDVVQEAWLRLQRTGPETIRDLDGWLVTVVGRLALDAATSARARRESYVGEWLPEPLVDADPADRVTLAESVGMALMVVLQQLSPAERTAFVLHDVFGYGFAQVGEIVGRSEAAARQLASRARRHVEQRRPRFGASREEHRAVVEAFIAAASGANLDALLRLLDPDVVLRADGGGVVPAALRPLRGARTVGRMLLAFGRRAAVARMEWVHVNGLPGLLVEEENGVRSVFAFTVAHGRIAELDVIRNPEKLRHLR